MTMFDGMVALLIPFVVVGFFFLSAKYVEIRQRDTSISCEIKDE